ncbi:MAG: hypothetical protein MHM6MM_008385 [Cercozoa sp. M6MM]
MRRVFVQPLLTEVVWRGAICHALNVKFGPLAAVAGTSALARCLGGVGLAPDDLGPRGDLILTLLFVLTGGIESSVAVHVTQAFILSGPRQSLSVQDEDDFVRTPFAEWALKQPILSCASVWLCRLLLQSFATLVSVQSLDLLLYSFLTAEDWTQVTRVYKNSLSDYWQHQYAKNCKIGAVADQFLQDVSTSTSAETCRDAFIRVCSRHPCFDGIPDEFVYAFSRALFQVMHDNIHLCDNAYSNEPRVREMRSKLDVIVRECFDDENDVRKRCALVLRLMASISDDCDLERWRFRSMLL